MPAEAHRLQHMSRPHKNIAKGLSMENVSNEFDYRFVIQKTFTQRRAKNASYSLRAFARDIDISSGVLCQILNGKREMKPKTARLLGLHLGYQGSSLETFVALTELQNLRNRAAKLEGKLRLHQNIAALEAHANIDANATTAS